MATLVARGVPAAAIFEALVTEVGRLIPTADACLIRFESDGQLTVIGRWDEPDGYLAVGTRHRFDTGTLAEPGVPAELTRGWGWRSSVGAPVIVDGHVWGLVAAGATTDRELPAATERQLAELTELLGIAIASEQSRQELEQLAAEHAALQRVAMLVAEGASPTTVFEAVTREVGVLFDNPAAGTLRYNDDDTFTIVASLDPRVEIGSRWPVEPGGASLVPTMLRTGLPARLDTWDGVPGEIAREVRASLAFTSSVGAPILLGGRIWGALTLHATTDRPFPSDTEAKLLHFAKLVSTAIDNAEARSEVERLAEEQAALRRVATLVSRQAPPAQVFTTIAAEVGALLAVDGVSVLRYEPGGQAVAVAGWGEPDLAGFVGRSYPILGDNPVALAIATSRPARRVYADGDQGPLAEISRRIGIVSAAASPIVVEGRAWGAVVVVSLEATPLPPETEARLEDFTELAATAIANVKARTDLSESRARVVRASDEARRRVVRDLHDGAQQRLVHTIVMLKLARQSLELQDDRTASLLEDALVQAESANVALRELAHGILPSVLTSGGLRAGIESVVSRLELPVVMDVEERRFPAEIEASAYFIVAEALTNVIKHAHATRAQVTVSARDDSLHIVVRDDGVGGADPNGHGLVGIGDRATTLQGRLDVESPAGGGTTVTATLSLPR